MTTDWRGLLAEVVARDDAAALHECAHDPCICVDGYVGVDSAIAAARHAFAVEAADIAARKTKERQLF